MTQHFRSKPREKIQSFWLKKLSHWWNLKIQPNFLGQNESIFLLSAPREKLSHFDPKTWVTCGTKFWHNFFGQNDSIFCELSHFDLKSWVTGKIIIRPGKVNNWRIFESIELSKLSQFDSQCWFNLTLNVEPFWLSMLSQFDSQCWVNLTLNVESIWLSTLSQFDS